MNIISVINNKGGVGKTTSTQNLAVFLEKKNFKVGIIDFDSQANLSSSFDYEEEGKDLLTALRDGEQLSESDFSKVKGKNIFILTNSKDINSGTMGIIPEVKRIGSLKRIIKNLKFDILLIDTAPSLDINTLCPLFASSHVLIPINFEKYSIQGLSSLFESIDILNEDISPNIKILGVFATKVDERLAMTDAYRPILESNMSEHFLKSFIRTNSKYQQAQDSGQNIFDIHDQKGIEDYTNLGNEILKRLN